MTSITEDPLHVTDVLSEPLITSRSPSPAAQSDKLLPRASDLAFPHYEKWALKSPEDEPLTGQASSDAFANPVQEVLERDQVAVGRNVNAHHRHSIPLDRDIAVATVEQNAGGAQHCCPGYGCQSIQIPDPVERVIDAMQLSHHREGDLALPDSLEEQVLRPSLPSQVTLEEPLEFIGPTPWPPPGHLQLLRWCCLAFLPPLPARGRVVSSWFSRVGGTCHPTHPVVGGGPERLAQGALVCRGRTASGTMSAFAAPVPQVSSVHGGHTRSPYVSQFQTLEALQGPPRDGYDPRGGLAQDNFACLGWFPCSSYGAPDPG